LNHYTEKLKAQPALAHLPFERWAEVLQEAVNWGLLSPHPQIPIFLQLQPIFPYFLKTRLNTEQQGKFRQAVETAFREYYDDLGGSMYALMNSKEANQKQMGFVLAKLEYENLMTALNLALGAQVSIANVYVAISSYLDMSQAHELGLDLGKMVFASLEKYPQEELSGKLGSEFVGILDNIANRYLLLKQYSDAERSYRKALDIWVKNKSFEADEIKKMSATIYHQLGRVAQEQRQWQQAEDYYKQALNIEIEFNDRYEQARTYGQLGVLARTQEQWEQAGEYLLKALEIYVEYNDQYIAGIVLRNLSRLWQSGNTPGLAAAVAGVLGHTHQAKQLF